MYVAKPKEEKVTQPQSENVGPEKMWIHPTVLYYCKY